MIVGDACWDLKSLLIYDLWFFSNFAFLLLNRRFGCCISIITALVKMNGLSALHRHRGANAFSLDLGFIQQAMYVLGGNPVLTAP